MDEALEDVEDVDGGHMVVVVIRCSSLGEFGIHAYHCLGVQLSIYL